MSKKHQNDTILGKLCFTFALIGVCLILLPSCNEINGQRSGESGESVEALKLEVEFLTSQVEWIRKDLEKQSDDYWELSEKISILELKEESKNSAFFLCF